jgi:hypothetical protein
MPIVTIHGQLGSGAAEIGRQVAARLHLAYVDREIISEVAVRLRWQEQDEKEVPPGGFLGRIVEALGHGYSSYGTASPPVSPTWEILLQDARYLESLESVIRELAASQSLVIFGRGSQFILRDYPGAFHILVVAPLEMRIKRVMDSLKLGEKAARQEIERSDNGGRQFIRRYFHAELEDPRHYDLVINTEHLSFDAAASIVVGALPFKDRNAGGQGV